MRIAFCLSFMLITTISSFGQDCNTLNNFNTFHGIRFGQIFPDSLKKHFELTKDQDHNYMYYEIEQKQIMKTNEFYKFLKWFNFGGVIFSFYSIDCLLDERVFQFGFQKVYNKNDHADIEDSVEIANDRLPISFIKSSDELNLLFGTMSKTKNETNALGYHLYRIWECEKNRVELELWYTNKKNNSMLNEFQISTIISFTNKELEKIRKIKAYQN